LMLSSTGERSKVDKYIRGLLGYVYR